MCERTRNCVKMARVGVVNAVIYVVHHIRVDVGVVNVVIYAVRGESINYIIYAQ